MKCPEAARLLHVYVDDELEPAAVLGLEEHLRGCARCRARAESLRELRAAVQRHTEYRLAPAGLRARLQESIGAGTASGAMRRERRVAFAAAGLALLALAVGLWRAGPESGPAAKAQSKVVYHITSSGHAGAALRTLRNHLEASPGTKVVVVAHNEGVDFLLRGARDESGALYEDAVRRFKTRGVDFRVCNNTLVRREIGPGGIIPEATLVPSGIAEVGRLQEQEGYAYLRM
ncbi:MAG: DsrE family protein [Steroidobacteraceae bacterium]